MNDLQGPRGIGAVAAENGAAVFSILGGSRQGDLQLANGRIGIEEDAGHTKLHPLVRGTVRVPYGAAVEVNSLAEDHRCLGADHGNVYRP